MTETRTTSSTGGQKGVKKARLSLFPPEIEWLLSEHYGRGAEKYDDNNWQKGYEWSKSYEALRRHLLQFWSGEDYDTDPEFADDPPLHIIAALWHCAALAWYALHKPEFDDRPKGQKIVDGRVNLPNKPLKIQGEFIDPFKLPPFPGGFNPSPGVLMNPIGLDKQYSEVAPQTYNRVGV